MREQQPPRLGRLRRARAARPAVQQLRADLALEGGDPDVTIVGTGSELATAIAAGELLAGEGVRARIVSMPSWELFAAQ
ncbi:MAG: transketolase-like TK C-terminal-containing protein, partial [Solirubrobacteraceae bacterium]